MSITKKDYLAFKIKVETELLPLLRRALHLTDPQKPQNNTEPSETNTENTIDGLVNKTKSITEKIGPNIEDKLGTTNNVMGVIEEKKKVL